MTWITRVEIAGAVRAFVASMLAEPVRNLGMNSHPTVPLPPGNHALSCKRLRIVHGAYFARRACRANGTIVT